MDLEPAERTADFDGLRAVAAPRRLAADVLHPERRNRPRALLGIEAAARGIGMGGKQGVAGTVDQATASGGICAHTC